MSEDRIPDRRADPCSRCGGDHTEAECRRREENMETYEVHSIPIPRADDLTKPIVEAIRDALGLTTLVITGTLDDGEGEEFAIFQTSISNSRAKAYCVHAILDNDEGAEWEFKKMMVASLIAGEKVTHGKQVK